MSNSKESATEPELQAKSEIATASGSGSNDNDNNTEPADDEANLMYTVSDHGAFCKATTAALEELCRDDPLLWDLPYDFSAEELEAQIALARGQAITVYVERDGLSTLKVVIPKPTATVADLKRSIRATVETQKSRQLRKSKSAFGKSSTSTSADSKSATSSSNPNSNSFSSFVAAVRSSCKNPHRRAVSWKFIWRAYVLCDVVTNQPLIDGRQPLSDLGIVNKSLLKFTKREHIFGRTRSLARRRYRR